MTGLFVRVLQRQQTHCHFLPSLPFILFCPNWPGPALMMSSQSCDATERQHMTKQGVFRNINQTRPAQHAYSCNRSLCSAACYRSDSMCSTVCAVRREATNHWHSEWLPIWSRSTGEKEKKKAIANLFQSAQNDENKVDIHTHLK